jgi:hypothetical protein
VSTGFKISLFLHILSVVVAFAPAILTVVPGGRDGALGVVERAGRTVYSPALILAGLFGIGCIFSSSVGGVRLYDFSDTWVSLALVVWVAMNGVFHALVLVGQRQGDERKVVNGEAIMTVLLIVMVYLMIWKPGGGF